MIVVTSPDTSAVRAWAREHGFDVADRGRLPAEVRQAYDAAHRSKAAAKQKPAKAAPAPTRPAKPAAVKPEPAPEPEPADASDDRRLVALAEQLRALTERVAALESAAPAKPARRFRRTR